MDELLEKLHKSKALSAFHCRFVETEAQLTGLSTEEILLDNALVSSQTIAEVTSPGDMPAVMDKTAVTGVSRQLAEWLPESVARQCKAVVLRLCDYSRTIDVAIHDVNDLVARDKIVRALKLNDSRQPIAVPASGLHTTHGDTTHGESGRSGNLAVESFSVDFRQINQADIERTLDRVYGSRQSLEKVIGALQHTNDVELTKEAVDVPVLSELLSVILAEAVLRRASDIHLSPAHRLVSVRIRQDGVMRELCCFHSRYWAAVLVKLKVQCGMDIAETRAPQDGRFTEIVYGNKVDLRVASFPTLSGENAVIRIFDSGQRLKTLHELCLDDAVGSALQQLLAKQHGLVVVCGPTGSGKTTTLYALLQQLDADAMNIMTLEDPIEFVLPRIRQTAINTGANFGFAEGVRGLLRQDPDVIMVGEVRDSATCSLVCRAALTGHFVLTTTHAEDCIGAIERLLELGANAAVLASVLNTVVAQRLLRRCCQTCNGMDTSCLECDGIGYIGQVAVYEILPISQALKFAIANGRNSAELYAVASEDGLVDLRARACEYISQRITSIQELNRVLGPELGTSADTKIDSNPAPGTVNPPT